MKRAEYEMTKLLMVVFSVLFVYLVSWLLLRQLFSQPQSMMAWMTGEASQVSFAINALALLAAAGAGILAYYASAAKPESAEKKELRIIRRFLSADEQRVLDEVERADEITQDSLRFRLNWSKAKLSAVLTNLDKSDLVQRKREGKTYRIFLARGRKGSGGK